MNVVWSKIIHAKCQPFLSKKVVKIRNVVLLKNKYPPATGPLSIALLKNDQGQAFVCLFVSSLSFCSK